MLVQTTHCTRCGSDPDDRNSHARIVAGEIRPLERGIREENVAAGFVHDRPKDRNRLALADRVRAHEGANTASATDVIRRLDEPPAHIVQEARRTRAAVDYVADFSLLLCTLPSVAQVGRIAADV